MEDMRMDLAGSVINAVLVEGRSVAEVCEAHGISRSWLYELIARYREHGEEGLRPRSKRPHSSPTRVPASIEDEIVALRKELAKQRRARTITQLQSQLDRFRSYYNEVRPHRALGRRTPAQAFAARTKATPRKPGLVVPAQHRVRRDRVDSGGNVTLRYQSRLRHLGIGRRYAGTRVMLLVADRDIRVIADNGELLAEFTIDPTKDYQPEKRPGQPT